MNITKNTIDELNAEIIIKIVKEDYEQVYNKKLRELGQKVNMPGFRPGKVPAGLIKKMHGKQVLAEEVYNILADSMNKYIVDEKIDILGKPLPHEKNLDIDWDKDVEFEFTYDLGLAPVVDIKLSKSNKIDYFKITPDEKMIEERINAIAQQHGKNEESDKIDGNALIYADFIEIDKDGNPKENGIKTEGGTILFESIKDEKLKKDLKNKKVGDKISFNLKTTFPNQFDASSMLKVDKKQLENNDSDFTMSITKITNFIPAKVDIELFKLAFENEDIKTLKEFKEKLVVGLEKELEYESNYKFHIDAREELIKKFKFDLPENFLKRFILSSRTDEKLTEEKLNEDFHIYLEQFRWEIIKSKIIKDNNIEITEEEIFNYAKMITQSQFMQYGMNYIPDEYLIQYSQKLLENEDEKYKIIERIYEDKVVSYVKETVKLNEKEVSLDQLKKLLEKK